MSNDLNGSKTEENLKKALQGEALAHLKYQFYKKELNKYTTEYDTLFDEIIHNEKEHGKIWFKKLHQDTIPENKINLEDAITGELYEHKEMYPEFSAIAEEEGFLEISKLFYEIGKIEEQHYIEYKTILDSIQDDKIFKSEDIYTRWKCGNCGHIIVNKNAPEECPVCKHPKKYFKRI